MVYEDSQFDFSQKQKARCWRALRRGIQVGRQRVCATKRVKQQGWITRIAWKILLERIQMWKPHDDYLHARLSPK